MTGRQTIARVLIAFAVCWLALPVAPAAAHFGNHGELPVSNYRTRILSITPPVEGLTLRVLDAGGRLELTWRGDGDLLIEGYEGEPYLRVGAEGVFTNLRSTATYLNQDRYGTAAPPSMADNDAAPSWSKVGDGRTVRWHDHRSHWMSPQPPAAVAADPGTEQPVLPAWSIGMTAGTIPVTVAGDVTWVPPPSSLPWYAAAVVVGAAVLAALHTRWWRTVAWVVVGLLGVAMVVSLLLARSAGADLTFWPVVARAIVLVAAAGLVLTARRRVPYPPLPLLVAGVVGVYFGGWRAAGVLSHSQLTVSGPHWLIRSLVTACFALSAAAIVRVAGFVLAAIVRPDGPQARALGAGRHQPAAAAE
jgi:hypothetical protein